MDPFDEWVKSPTQQHPCFQLWADRLTELGATWDSFHREHGEVVDDLVAGGIPLLAARDIVNIASAEVKRSIAPMAVFWDLENMPIPSATSGRDVTCRLKSILASHGDLVQFRGYASIGLGNIPQEKRSDLQLSGCTLVDCPHNGRKEVADKMIIVDAMQFAFLHPEGATLCFISGDVDYAYLLAVLQRPQWRTIVISKGKMQSMLHVNCDMKMRWETDILQLRHATGPAAAGFNQSVEHGRQTVIEVATNSDAYHIDIQDTVGEGGQFLNSFQGYFEPLTADEEWEDDLELLWNIIKTIGTSILGFAPTALKSHVGCVLRQTNPARFPHRESIRSFFVLAIERGAVAESGQGATKMLSIPSELSTRTSPAISSSERLPLPMQDVPERVLEMRKQMPFVIFARWACCPPGNTFPKGTFVHSCEEWAILMFHTQTSALRAVAELPWLRSGTLVDWRQVDNTVGTTECSFQM